MKIIKSSYEILTDQLYENPVKFIELCGRLAYKSEDRITDDSAKTFIQSIKNRKHYAVLEHSNFIFSVPAVYINVLPLIFSNSFLRVSFYENLIYISGNARAWIEIYEQFPELIEGFLSYLHYTFPDIFDPIDRINHEYLSPFHFISNPRELPTNVREVHDVESVRFICNRGFTHELVRHRAASYLQESTRFCNYSKEKFGDEITVIDPCWFAPGTIDYDDWKKGCEHDEITYFKHIKRGRKPQEARGNLPIDLKTEIVITANLREWKHIFSLRNAPAAHPSMRELMEPLNNEFKEKLPEIFG